MSILTDPQTIGYMRMVTQLSALKLEILGMKKRGESAFSMIKREYALSGKKQEVYDKFKKMVEEAKACLQ